MINFTPPVLAEILENRPVSWAIVGAAVVHSGMVLAGLPAWPCPVQRTLGIPCPGCGLSRAISALLHGDWRTSLTYHAFAPLLLAGLVLLGAVTLLPAAARQRAIYAVRQVEQRTGVVTIVLVGLVVYWLARLLLYREAFIHLIAG